MKDIIQDRLNRISDLKERRLLKEILFDVYENVVEYNLMMYEQLEKRIYDEIDDPLDKFYIYTSLELGSSVDPISDFLHPIVDSDIEEMTYDIEEINKKLQHNEEMVLTSIFMKCNYLMIKEILEQEKTYKGFVRTDKDIHEIQVTLKQSEKYIHEIEKLYHIFQYNGILWNTVNCPYAYKFVDIVLSSSLKFKAGEKITEITIDLVEYEQYKVVNAIPLWNVKTIMVQDKSFPMPAKDRINYDHVVSLSDLGTQNGYMVGLNNRDFMYCKQQEQDLVILSSSDSQQQWELIQIESPFNSRQKDFTYELMSNKRDLGFLGRYASVKSMVIRTKGEIARLLQSYELSKELAFQTVEIKERYEKEKETTDYNSFVDDNIRIDAYKKIMLLKFKAEDREDFLVLDKMSFLVSEMQILFPEYKCIGTLL